jgi:phosphoribosyl-AMP cyclohydrolase
MADMLEPRFNADGLAPAVVQDAADSKVLMLAWMDAEALRRTLETRRATYWSRSRQTHWVKGETSGHRQRVREVRLDCDGDTILLKVDQLGPACHTGSPTCFDATVLLADSPSADPVSADPVSANPVSADRVEADPTSAGRQAVDSPPADSTSAGRQSADSPPADSTSAGSMSADTVSEVA